MKLVNSATKFRHGIDKFYQPNSGLRGSWTEDKAIYTHYVYTSVCIAHGLFSSFRPPIGFKVLNVSKSRVEPRLPRRLLETQAPPQWRDSRQRHGGATPGGVGLRGKDLPVGLNDIGIIGIQKVGDVQKGLVCLGRWRSPRTQWWFLQRTNWQRPRKGCWGRDVGSQAVWFPIFERHIWIELC